MPEQESNLAILFVDVIVDSRKHESIGDAANSPEVRDCVSLFQQIAIDGGGRVVRPMDDGAMCAFPNADLAALAACEMQARVQLNPSAQTRKLSIRIGLHFGSPFTAGIVAQRMAILAASGQIITNDETRALLSVQQRNAIRPHTVPARVKQETITVYEILWQADTEQTQMPGHQRPVLAEVKGPRLRLIHGDREIAVVAKITIGRRSQHGIALKSPAVSRDHAYIELRDERFVLVDQSTFGTYVRLDNGRELKLSHAEVVLRGSGVISFSRHSSEQGAELVSFWCEPDVARATQPEDPPRT